MVNTASRSIELRLLGSIEARRNGGEMPLGGPRQRVLLALLALHPGRTISSDRLVHELWGGDPPDGADTTLRSYVSRLRVSLDDPAIVRRSAGGYALDVEPDQIDTARFERLIREAADGASQRNPRRASTRAREALDLWRGRPFAELGFEGLLRAEADRLEELRLHAIELLLEARLAFGASGELVDELETLVREHPYREAFWRQLMTALYRAERQADALGAYHRARAALDEQLGIEPGADLQALQAAILQHDLPAAEVDEPFASLPVPLTSFIGRGRELDQIRTLLSDGRLVTLAGIGGVGKTRLALEAARSASDDRRDGVSFVDLSAATKGDEVDSLLARSLDVPEQPEQSLHDLLEVRLRPLDVLIVLDNCEHVRESAAALADRLLRRCPAVRILATSREILGLPGESVYQVPPLEWTDPIGTDGESEALALFLARVREARPQLVLDGEARDIAVRICEILDGLPLAIELAAARSKALSLAQIEGRLSDRFRFLISWRRLTPARHRTLREAMAWSHDLLQHEEQAFYAQLSVFVGGFTLDAAAAVCLDGDEDLALRLIERLTDASLVTAREDDGATRFRMLETVREDAADRLGGARDAVAERHARFYLSLAEARLREVEEAGRLTPLSRLASEDVNLRAALHHLRATAPGDGDLRMCAALWRYWWLRGDLSSGRQHLDAALERAGPMPTMAMVDGLRGASSLALRQGEIDAAVRLAEKAVGVATTVGEIPLGRAETALANAMASFGDADRAAELYHAATARFRETGMEWDLGIALLNLGDLGFMRHDLDGVEAAATESLAIFRRTGDDAGIAVDLGNLAYVALERGEVDQAEELLLDALRRSSDMDVAEWVSIMLDGLAAVAAARAHVTGAAELMGAAMRLRGEIGTSLESIEGRVHERTMSVVRAALDPDALESALSRGKTRSTAEAVQLALGPRPG